MSSYGKNLALEFDRSCAVLFFNEQDITVSSLCYLVRTFDGDALQMRAPLHHWQIVALRWIASGLEFFWRGHCAAARAADMQRGAEMQARLR